jgi:hypothetical protein
LRSEIVSSANLKTMPDGKRVLTVRWPKREANSDKGRKMIGAIVEFLETGKCRSCARKGKP